MKPEFHIHNRQNLYAALPDGALAVLFSGTAPRQSADAYYPFFCNRNYPFEISPPSERCCWVLLKPRKPLKIRQFIHAKAL